MKNLDVDSGVAAEKRSCSLLAKRDWRAPAELKMASFWERGHLVHIHRRAQPDASVRYVVA